MATTFDLTLPLGSTSLPDESKEPQVHQAEVYGADEETLIRLFRTKMKFALAEAGYDQDAQYTVSELVERNVISCGIALNDQQPGSLLENLSVQSQLTDLMAGGFNINSNEPVLLILFDGGYETFSNSVRAIKEASCTILRENFHVYPIRVYIACHPDEGSRSDVRGGFSLALLNVVNTDIGGPGMVQLLDDEIASPDWKRMIVLAEAWNRTELLWTNEKEMLPASRFDNHPSVFLSSESAHSKEDIAQDGQVMMETEQESSIVIEDGLDVRSVEETSRRTSISDHPVVVEHPAIAEHLAREASRPPVMHPTWNHTSSGSDSLLDLIRMQASTIEHSDAETDPVEVEVEGESSKVLSSIGSDNEFELV